MISATEKNKTRRKKRVFKLLFLNRALRKDLGQKGKTQKDESMTHLGKVEVEERARIKALK